MSNPSYANDLAAVKQNGYALEHIENQTLEICLAAVKENGGALQFVKNQTPEICRAAVKENGLALQLVKNQTPEICLAAVKQNGYALEYVEEKTPELYRIALQKGFYNLDLIRLPNLLDYIDTANVPVIKNIHQTVFEAASRPGALDMESWHKPCGTTHCRAGWVVDLAGLEGYALEEKTSTSYAALAIYKASDPSMTEPPDFLCDDDDALDDMKRLADLEREKGGAL